MVCVYCSGKTKIINSRVQKRLNQKWRRRQCKICLAIFTTLELIDTSSALRVKNNGRYEPFLRDKLFLSVHDSLLHRKTASRDATALTDTVISTLSPYAGVVSIESSEITKTTSQVLKRFDKVAATHYQAFHPI